MTTREIPPGMVKGVNGRHYPRHPLSASELMARTDAILRLRAEGKSVRAIVAELGLSVGTVHRTIQQNES